MSTTMPSASRSARRNVASTTYVAPCSPRRAEDLAPETVRDHDVIADGDAEQDRPSRRFFLPLLIDDTDTQGRKVHRRPDAASAEAGLEAALVRDQRVEYRVGEQAQGQRQPVPELRARAGGATAPTWLLRTTRRREWKNSPSGTLTRRSPIPAQLDDLALDGEQLDDRASPASVALACTTGRTPPPPLGRGEPDAERLGDGRARGVDVDRSTLTPESGRARRRPPQPTIPAPTTAIRSPTTGPRPTARSPPSPLSRRAPRVRAARRRGPASPRRPAPRSGSDGDRGRTRHGRAAPVAHARPPPR